MVMMNAYFGFALAAAPVITGTNAAPTMAVVIKPDISLVFSGMRSTAMEKINGNMLAKPMPMRMKLNHVVTVLYGKNNKTLPNKETRMVTNRKVFGLITRKQTPPKKRPTKSAMINTMLPKAGVMLGLPSIKTDGIRLNMDASAPQ